MLDETKPIDSEVSRQHRTYNKERSEVRHRTLSSQ